MEKLTEGYEEFIKGKKTDPKGAEKFEQVLKKAAKPRASK